MLLENTASSIYMFDRKRTGRLKYSKGHKEVPEFLWRYKLPSFPVKCPESTPVFDSDNNIYFGSHDGCFYSLTYTGDLRWFFKTDKKIYSSPLITRDNKVVFASGDGYVYCLDSDGNLLWYYNLTSSYLKALNKYKRKIIKATRPMYKFITKYFPKNVWECLCWSSPNVSDDGILYITGYGLGLHAIDIASGDLKWEFDLGSPRFHLSGVAINDNQDILVASQKKKVLCISETGVMKWECRIRKGYDTWGNPSIDSDTKSLFVSANYRQSKGIIYCIGLNGKIKWQTNIEGGVRGSVSISHGNHVIACGLNGHINYLHKETGEIVNSVKIASSDMGLWTTVSIDPEGYIFATTKDSNKTGSLVCLDTGGNVLWRYEKLGKALVTPVIDENARVYVGSWNGEFTCLQT